jgi:hypothetical protein
MRIEKVRMRGNQKAKVSMIKIKNPKIDSLLFELARRTLPCLHKEYLPFSPYDLRIPQIVYSAFLFILFTQACSDDKPAPRKQHLFPLSKRNRACGSAHQT